MLEDNVNNNGSRRARQACKLRDSCEICARAKVKCSREKPACARCVSRRLVCEYALSRRNGRAATTRSSNDNDHPNRTSESPNGAPSDSQNMRRDSALPEYAQHRPNPWIHSFINSQSSDASHAGASAFPPDSNLLNQQDIDMFMSNDVTAWQNVPIPPNSATCGTEHCCFNIALDRLRELTIVEASRACPRKGIPEENPPPTLEMAAIMNRNVISSIGNTLECTCSLNGNFLNIISLVIFKLIAWCAGAAKNTPRANPSTAGNLDSNAPIALRELLQGTPAGLDGLMEAVGATGNEQIVAAAQSVLDDLYRVQDLVDTFSKRLAIARRRRDQVGAAECSTDIGAAVYNPSTTLSPQVSTLIEADLRRRLRAVAFETVQVLLRG